MMNPKNKYNNLPHAQYGGGFNLTNFENLFNQNKIWSNYWNTVNRSNEDLGFFNNSINRIAYVDKSIHDIYGNQKSPFYDPTFLDKSNLALNQSMIENMQNNQNKEEDPNIDAYENWYVNELI